MATNEARIIDLTVTQLETLISNIVKESLLIQEKKQLATKLFCSPREFGLETGIPYSTVIYMCKEGKIKARQEDINCSWKIDATEIIRLKNEADNNLF
jgi:hypothetical protein